MHGPPIYPALPSPRLPKRPHLNGNSICSPRPVVSEETRLSFNITVTLFKKLPATLCFHYRPPVKIWFRQSERFTPLLVACEGRGPNCGHNMVSTMANVWSLSHRHECLHVVGAQGRTGVSACSVAGWPQRMILRSNGNRYANTPTRSCVATSAAVCPCPAWRRQNAYATFGQRCALVLLTLTILAPSTVGTRNLNL
jgi:hypothetical protein